MPRKTRIDSKLGNLPEATQRAIFALSDEHGLSVAKIRELLEMPEGVEDKVTCFEGFGVGKVGVTALYAFLKEWRTKTWRENLHKAAEAADSVKDSLSEQDRDQIDSAIMDGLREWIFESIVNRQIDSKSAKSLIGLIQKERAQDIDERKLALLEKKAAQADEANGVLGDKKLTPEEKQKRLEGIFGFGG